MRSIKYLLCVIIIALFGLDLSAQVRTKIELLADNTTYQVSIAMDRDLLTPFNIITNSTLTIIAPTGGLDLTNLENINGSWERSSFVESPPENNSFDYYTISLRGLIDDVEFTEDVFVPIFSFENNAICLSDISFINNVTDPFIFNSANINVGNLFVVSGIGPFNAFDNDGFEGAPCPDQLDATASATVGTLACSDDVTTMVIDIQGGSAPFTIIYTNTTTGEVDSVISNQLNTPVTIQNIEGGDYTIRIQDDKNGSSVLTEVVSAPEPIELDIAVTFANCENSLDGAIEIMDINRMRNISYEWSNGLDQTTRIEDLNEGTYMLTVTDENGCAITEEVIVKMDGWIDVDAVANEISCYGMDDGELAITATGKNAPFTYNWDNGTDTGTGDNLTGLIPGMYDITVTDATGVCNEVVTSLEITEPAEVTALALVDSSSICELETESIVTVEDVENSRGALSYSLDGINFNSSNRFVVDAGESYMITVRDAAGCTANVDATIPAPSGLSVDLPTDLILNLGDDLDLDADFAATTDVNFEWSPAESLSCSDCPNPQATPTSTTTYTLTVSDDNGCIKEASVIVFLSTTRRVYIPNAFSPNGDGLNDLFTIFTSTDAVSVNTLQIFDRWGERVYQSPDSFIPNIDIGGTPSGQINHGWDGTINGQIAPNEVYVYLTEITFIDGKTEVFSGELTLAR